MDAAVEALERRLVEGSKALTDMEHEVSRTKSLIKAICQRLKDEKLEETDNTSPKSLVNDVYNLCEDSIVIASTSKRALRYSLVKFNGPWFKINNSLVVVGCKVIGDAKYCLRNLSFDLTVSKPVDQKTLLSDQVKKRDGIIQQLKKRARMELRRQLRTFHQGAESLEAGMEMFILAEFPLSCLEPDFSLTVSVVLRYCFDLEDGSIHSHSITSDPLCIGSSSLFNRDSLINLDFTHSDEENLERTLAVLHMTGEEALVDLKSTESTSLLAINHMLTSRLNLSYNVLLGIWFWPQGKCPFPPLEGAWIEIRDILQIDRLDVGLHARDENSLLLLVNFLYDRLPDDVVITSQCPDSTSSSVTSQLFKSMLKEAEFVSQRLEQNRHPTTGKCNLDPDSRDELNTLEAETDDLATMLSFKSRMNRD